MSSSLYWKPVNTDRNYLPDELKHVLQRRCKSASVDLILDNKDIQYIRALCHADIKGAKELLDAIHMYGQIRVKEES